MSEHAMGQIAAGLPTKSAKIRALAAAGYARADIARYLGVRYQHVRNVLEQPLASLARSALPGLAESAMAYGPQPMRSSNWLDVTADGRVVLPTALRRALGVENGGAVYVEFDNGTLRLKNRAEALREAQETVSQYTRGKGSLVDALLAERRSEAARENDDER